MATASEEIKKLLLALTGWEEVNSDKLNVELATHNNENMSNK